MTNEKRALSWQEFLDSGFDGRDYNFPDFEGTFEAEMVCKRWDKNSKLLVYLFRYYQPEKKSLFS